ncbi:MAG: hypothetical protein QOC70_151 [Verrucomicrobiota bacterium]
MSSALGWTAAVVVAAMLVVVVAGVFNAAGCAASAAGLMASAGLVGCEEVCAKDIEAAAKSAVSERDAVLTIRFFIRRILLGVLCLVKLPKKTFAFDRLAGKNTPARANRSPAGAAPPLQKRRQGGGDEGHQTSGQQTKDENGSAEQDERDPLEEIEVD